MSSTCPSFQCGTLSRARILAQAAAQFRCISALLKTNTCKSLFFIVFVKAALGLASATHDCECHNPREGVQDPPCQLAKPLFELLADAIRTLTIAVAANNSHTAHALRSAFAPSGLEGLSSL